MAAAVGHRSPCRVGVAFFVVVRIPGALLRPGLASLAYTSDLRLRPRLRTAAYTHLTMVPIAPELFKATLKSLQVAWTIR